MTDVDLGKIAFRFWTKTIPGDNGCLEWSGALCKDGYGRTTIKRKDFRAHRLAYEIYYGEPPKNKLVCHRCDNPRCVNPRHLF